MTNTSQESELQEFESRARDHYERVRLAPPPELTTRIKAAAWRQAQRFQSQKQKTSPSASRGSTAREFITEDRFYALAAADHADTQRLSSETGRFTIDRKVDEDNPGRYLYVVTVIDATTVYEGRSPILQDQHGQIVQLSPIQDGRARTATTVARLHGPIELQWTDTSSPTDDNA